MTLFVTWNFSPSFCRRSDVFNWSSSRSCICSSWQLISGFNVNSEMGKIMKASAKYIFAIRKLTTCLPPNGYLHDHEKDTCRFKCNREACIYVSTKPLNKKSPKTITRTQTLLGKRYLLQICYFLLFYYLNLKMHTFMSINTCTDLNSICHLKACLFYTQHLFTIL